MFGKEKNKHQLLLIRSIKDMVVRIVILQVAVFIIHLDLVHIVEEDNNLMEGHLMVEMNRLINQAKTDGELNLLNINLCIQKTTLQLKTLHLQL